MKIINFMQQHELSKEQLDTGLFNPNLSIEELNELKSLMNVDPNKDCLYENAQKLFSFINKIMQRENCNDFHIMGQANLMVCLFLLNQSTNYGMWESTTERVSKDVVNADGTTTKTNIFKFVKLRKYGF